VKQQFKNQVRPGISWYDSFFKINRRPIVKRGQGREAVNRQVVNGQSTVDK